MKEPKAPKLPPNPIEKAEERFMSDLNPVYGLLKNSMDGMQPFYSARSLPIIDPAILTTPILLCLNQYLYEITQYLLNAISCHIKMIPSLMGYILFRLEKENSK